MIISSNLCSVPFISNTDTVRLQMASKQLAQAFTHTNCERPYVVGKHHAFIRLNQGDALHDGEVVYIDNTIMVVYYTGCEKEYLETYEIPKYKHTKDGASSSLRSAHPIGKFKKGDILFEYDGFLGGIPSFGYNLNVGFFPFFSFNCEDAVIISETAARKCRQRKIETVFIPVYTYSSFKQIYPMSKYGFIPDVGQTIDGKIIFSQMFEKSIKSDRIAKVMSFYKHNEAESNNMIFNSYNVLTKYENAEISDIRVHLYRKSSDFKIVDKEAKLIITKMAHDHNKSRAPIYDNLKRVFGQEYAVELIQKYYFWHNLTSLNDHIDFSNLQCMIEIKLTSDHQAEIGDKFANRYANKGVVSMVLPDHLRPYSKTSGIPIDYICNPLSVFNRMNFGQIIEGSVAKAVAKAEGECKNDPDKLPEYARKFSKFSALFGDKTYTNELLQYADRLENDEELKNEVHKDLDNGLYFEAPSFVAIDAVEMTRVIENEFDITVTEDVVIPVATFEYMKYKIGNDVIVPSEDVVMKDVFTTPMYILKLKHLSGDKMTAHDFGRYKAGSLIPAKVSGFDRASKLGSMEMDSLIASNTLKAMREFRTVKSDVPSMKQDMVEQILTTGIYNMPDESADEGVKIVINNLIKMVNN